MDNGKKENYIFFHVEYIDIIVLVRSSIRSQIDENEEDMYLNNLSVTRFIAALMVVLFHFGSSIDLISRAPWTDYITNGGLAVNYFYVLSGFLMAVVHGGIRKGQVASFYISRFARIYPLYIANELWHSWTGGRGVIQSLPNLLLIQAWLPGHAMAGNSVGWSLSVEAGFYVFFPFLMMMARYLGISAFLGLTAFVWIVSNVVFGYIYTGMQNASEWQLDLVFRFPLLHLNSFLWGMGAAIISPKIKLRSWNYIALSLLSLLLIGRGIHDSRWFTALTGLTMQIAGGMYSPLFAIIILCIVNLKTKILDNSIFVFIGNISYAIYISQISLMVFFVLHVWGSWELPPDKFIIYLLSLLSVSAMVFVCFEEPMRLGIKRIGDRVLNARRRRPQPMLGGDQKSFPT